MNRCLTFLKTIYLLLMLAAGLSLLPATLSAQGMARQFPPAALRGVLEVTAPPQILLNGQPERLSPGARIKSPGNLLVLSASLVGQQLLINYLRDPQGMLHEIWILNLAEAQQKRAGLEPRNNFTFASDADKPKTDDGKTPFDQLPTFNSR